MTDLDRFGANLKALSFEAANKGLVVVGVVLDPVALYDPNSTDDVAQTALAGFANSPKSVPGEAVLLHALHYLTSAWRRHCCPDLPDSEAANLTYIRRLDSEGKP